MQIVCIIIVHFAQYFDLPIHYMPHVREQIYITYISMSTAVVYSMYASENIFFLVCFKILPTIQKWFLEVLYSCIHHFEESTKNTIILRLYNFAELYT